MKPSKLNEESAIALHTAGAVKEAVPRLDGIVNGAGAGIIVDLPESIAPNERSIESGFTIFLLTRIQRGASGGRYSALP